MRCGEHGRRQALRTTSLSWTRSAMEWGFDTSLEPEMSLDGT
jgi:hypothetical protein